MSGILLATVGNSYGYKPVNTVAPAITGTAQVRQTLTCSTGTWNAAPLPITYTYQWRANGSPISGATNSTYTIAVAYFGQVISCVVTATNVVGSTSATSNNTAAVIANVPTAPTIGTATATGSSTATISYTAPADNGGATITSYTAISSPGGITGTLSTSGSGTITVTGLSPSTSYTFVVRATNSVGNSANSSSSNSITTQEAYWVMTSTLDGQFAQFGVGSDANGIIGSIGGYVAPSGAAGLFRVNAATGAIVWAKLYGGSSFGSVQNSNSDSGSPQIISDGSTITSAAFRSSNNEIVVYRVNSSGDLTGSQWSLGATYGNALNSGYNGSITSDGSNFYFGGRITSSGTFIGRINSSGTYAWGKRADSNSGEGVTTAVYAPNGKIYSATLGMMINSASTGALEYGAKYSNTQLWGAATDSSSNFYVAGFTQYNSTYGPFFGRINTSTYDMSWGYVLTGGTSQVSLIGIVVDSSGNIYYGGQYVASNYASAVFIKTNSSGSILWARQVRFATGSNPSIGARRIALNSAQTAVYCLGYGTGNNCIMVKIPTDGSRTGTYGNFVYEAFPFGISSIVPPLSSATVTTFDTTNSSTGISMPQTNLNATTSSITTF